MTTAVGRSEDSSVLHFVEVRTPHFYICRSEDVLSSTFVGVRTSSVLPRRSEDVLRFTSYHVLSCCTPQLYIRSSEDISCTVEQDIPRII